jgi:prepilin-type N-terminal cleavage/methylation domain-containing protein
MRTNPLKKMRSGYTLIELLVAAGLMGVVVFAFASYKGLLLKSSSETKTRHAVEAFRNDLKSKLTDEESLCATLLGNFRNSASASQMQCVWSRIADLQSTNSSRKMVCGDKMFSTGIAEGFAVAPPRNCNSIWPGPTTSDFRKFDLYEVQSIDGSSQAQIGIKYVGIEPTAPGLLNGISLDGTPCNSFDRANGNEACPIRFNLAWRLECPTPAATPCTCQSLIMRITLEARFPSAPGTSRDQAWVNSLSEEGRGFSEIRVPLERCLDLGGGVSGGGG